MRWGKALMLAAVIAIALTAFAVGKGSSSKNLTLCAVKKGGDLSLASHGKCAKGEQKLKVAKRGPAGPPGKNGEDGSDATVKPEALHLVSPAGAIGTDCAASPGSFCTFSTQCSDPPWRNYGEQDGYGPVAFLKDAEGFVHLQGMAQVHYLSGGGIGDCSGAPAGIFFLPEGYRPTGGTLRFEGDDCYQSGAVPRRVEIDADGRVSVAASSCVSLSGITFKP